MQKFVKKFMQKDDAIRESPAVTAGDLHTEISFSAFTKAAGECIQPSFRIGARVAYPKEIAVISFDVGR